MKLDPLNVYSATSDICCRLVGLLWTECKAMYNAGLRVYMLDNYNWIDFIVLSVYLSSYVLRILVQQRIKIADQFYNGTARAREALLQHDVSLYDAIRDEIFMDAERPAYSYFMKACT